MNGTTGEITYTVTCPALAEHFRKNQRYFWLNTQGSGKPLRYIYSSGVYSPVSDEEIKGIIKHYITDYMPLSLKMKDVDEVFKDLSCDKVFRKAEELNADENVINFENGLLYLDTMELRPHNPSVLSTIQIPCKWNAAATSAPVFESFLNTLTSGDKEVQRFLMQFIGAVISNIYGYRMKSALFMVGPGNTGKSQLGVGCVWQSYAFCLKENKVRCIFFRFSRPVIYCDRPRIDRAAVRAYPLPFLLIFPQHCHYLSGKFYKSAA